MDIHPLTDPDDLPRKVDAIRDALANFADAEAKGATATRHQAGRDHLRALNISDAANRIGAQMAKHGYPWPEEDWLLETARIVLDGYDGVTRAPRKVQRTDPAHTCVDCGQPIALPTPDPFRCAKCRGAK